ncbi:MAG: hypothetical protein ACFCUE_11425 [Candidatus Bathyarchaeia archaeon]|jgi:hypothetical protein
MVEYSYPKEVTDSNRLELLEEARRINKKYFSVKYFLKLFFSTVIITAPITFGTLYLIVWLGINHYLDFFNLFPQNWVIPSAIIFVILSVGIVFTVTAFLSIFLLNWLARHRYGIPKHEEVIFAQSFLVGNSLLSNDREQAKQEAELLIAAVTTFCRDQFNLSKKVFAPEFTSIRRAKDQIERMIMFSKSPSLPNLFMNFGLAFVKRDNPQAFSNICEILERVKDYGEPRGKIAGLLTGLEKYPNSLPLLLSLTVTIITVVFFFLTGQQLGLGV